MHSCTVIEYNQVYRVSYVRPLQALRACAAAVTHSTFLFGNESHSESYYLIAQPQFANSLSIS
jgi:hypothetical protein